MDGNGRIRGYLIVTIVVLLVVGGFVLLINSVNNIQTWDDLHPSSEFKQRLIPLNNYGYPAGGIFPHDISAVSEIGQFPRLFTVTDECLNLRLADENTLGVYAMTSFIEPELVKIAVPAKTSGYVTVCPLADLKADVILWEQLPETVSPESPE